MEGSHDTSMVTTLCLKDIDCSSYSLKLNIGCNMNSITVIISPSTGPQKWSMTSVFGTPSLIVIKARMEVLQTIHEVTAICAVYELLKILMKILKNINCTHLSRNCAHLAIEDSKPYVDYDLRLSFQIEELSMNALHSLTLNENSCLCGDLQLNKNLTTIWQYTTSVLDDGNPENEAPRDTPSEVLCYPVETQTKMIPKDQVASAKMDACTSSSENQSSQTSHCTSEMSSNCNHSDVEESSLQCEQPMPWLYLAMTTYVVIIISQLRLIGKFISDTLWVICDNGSMKEECYCLDMQLIFWLTFLVVVVVTICCYSQITRTFHLFCHCVTVLAGRLWASRLSGLPYIKVIGTHGGCTNIIKATAKLSMLFTELPKTSSSDDYEVNITISGKSDSLTSRAHQGSSVMVCGKKKKAIKTLKKRSRKSSISKNEAHQRDPCINKSSKTGSDQKKVLLSDLWYSTRFLLKSYLSNLLWMKKITTSKETSKISGFDLNSWLKFLPIHFGISTDRGSEKSTPLCTSQKLCNATDKAPKLCHKFKPSLSSDFNVTCTNRYLDPRWIYSKVLGVAKNFRISKLLLFLIMIGSLNFASGNQVTLESSQTIYYVGSEAKFVCHAARNASNIQWYINDTRVQGTYSERLNLGVLQINVNSSFNDTTIHCEEVGVERSMSLSVFVQDILDSVSNIKYSLNNKSTVEISWSPPYSLDVPDTDIDITYCVDIVNMSSLAILHSQCQINATNFSWTYISRLVACKQYGIHITAVNDVGNSTVARAIAVNEVSSEFKVSLSNFTLNTSKFELDMDQDFCRGRTMLIINNHSIPFTPKLSNSLSFTLPNNQHFSNLTLKFMDPTGDAKVAIVRNSLKTYDVDNSSVNTNDSSKAIIRSSFISNSKASGVLAVFLLIEKNITEYSKSFYYTIMKDVAERGTAVSLNAGSYRVLTYDIEHGGVIQASGPPSTSEMITIEGSSEIDNKLDNNLTCSVDVEVDNANVQCNCEDYYQLVLFKKDNSILSKRSKCTESLELKNKDQYFTIAFVEQTYGGIYSSSIFSIGETTAATITQNITDGGNDVLKVIPAVTVILTVITLVAIAIIVIVHYIRKKEIIRALLPQFMP